MTSISVDLRARKTDEKKEYCQKEKNRLERTKKKHIFELIFSSIAFICIKGLYSYTQIFPTVDYPMYFYSLSHTFY